MLKYNVYLTFREIMSFHRLECYLFNAYQHQLLFCPYANKWQLMPNLRISSHQKPYIFITQALICKIIAPNLSRILLNSKYTLIKAYITLKYFLNNYFHFFANFVIFHLKMLIKSKSYRIRLAITFFLDPDTKSCPKRYDTICHQEWYRHLVWLTDYNASIIERIPTHATLAAPCRGRSECSACLTYVPKPARRVLRRHFGADASSLNRP